MRFVPSARPIGVDIGARSMRAVQLVGGRDSAVRAAAWVPRVGTGWPLGAEDASRLEAALERQGFEGNQVVLGLGDANLVSSMFELEEAAAVRSGPGTPMDTIARVEMSRATGCAPAALETLCWRLPKPARARTTTPILAVGCTHASAEAALGSFEATGLEVVALEARPAALARACARLLPGGKGLTTIVDLDWDQTLVVVTLDGAVVYHRLTQETGVGAVVEQVQRSLSLPMDAACRALERENLGTPADATVDVAVAEQLEALSQEVGMAITYAAHRYGENRSPVVLAAGDGSATRGLMHGLSLALGTEVGVLDVCGTAKEPGSGTERGSRSLGCALGLAMWEAEQEAAS